MPLPPTVRKAIRPIVWLLILIGFVCFIGQGVVSDTGLAQGRSVEWPIVSTNQAICLPDGRYAVPRDDIGRIQIYSPDRHFLYGWHAAYKMYSVQATPDGTLHVFGDKDSEKTYSPDGTLLSEKSYDPRFVDPHFYDPKAIHLSLPAPWWTFPLWGPMYAWITAAAGILIGILTTTREERQAQKRRATQPSIPGSAGWYIKGALQWFASTVGVVIGFLWFFGSIASLIICVLHGNLFGTIVLIPFTLIGVLLLFISITIVRFRYQEAFKALHGGPSAAITKDPR